MTPANLETLVPGLAALRAQERHNRALAFAGLTHTVCGVEVLPLTPMHRLRLQLVRNAFTAAGVDPLAGDVHQFLWLLSPGWVPAPGPWRRLACAWQQWRLRRHIRRLDLGAAVLEIYRYLLAQLQDSGERSCDSDGVDHGAWLHWAALDAGFWLNIHGGFTLETYRDTPYLVLQQLYRAYRCNHPNVTRGTNGDVQVEEPQFINGSDQLIGAWQRQHRAAIAEFIRNQTERGGSN